MSLYLLIPPSGKLNYTFDWSQVLNEGSTVTSASWRISPTGPTLSDQSISEDGQETTVFVADAARDGIYSLTCVATTSDGTEEVQSVTLRGYE